MLQAFVIALAGSISPTLVAITTFLMTRARPRAYMLCYTVGALLMGTTAGMILALGFADSRFANSNDSHGGGTFDIVIGVVMLVTGLAFLLWRDSVKNLRLLRWAADKHEARQAKKSEKKAKDPIYVRLGGSLPAVFVLGLATAVPGSVFLIGIKQIVQAKIHPDSVLLLAIFTFNVILFLPIEIPLIALGIKPDWTKRKIDVLDAWLRENFRGLAIGICFSLAAYMFWQGAKAGFFS
mgnify:CR=1 FL=1